MPSQKVLEQKAAAVDALAEKFGRAVSGILVQYQGITVEDDTKLRAAMRAAGVEYTVIKNSLIGRACDKAGFEAMKEHLEGMNAVAISYDDPIAPAKILKEYAEKIETFTLRAGFLDGAVVDEATVKSPISGLAVALQAVVDKNGEGAAEEAPAAAEEAAAE